MLNARVVKLLDEKSSKASLRSTHDCLGIYFSSIFLFNLEKVSPKVAIHAVCLKMIQKVMKCEAIFCDNNKKRESFDYHPLFTDSLQKPHETKSSLLWCWPQNFPLIFTLTNLFSIPSPLTQCVKINVEHTHNRTSFNVSIELKDACEESFV